MIQLIAIIGALAGFVACVAYWVQPGPGEVRKKNRLRTIRETRRAGVVEARVIREDEE